MANMDDDILSDADVTEAQREYEAMVNNSLRILNNSRKYTPEERRKAALFLGDSGEATAITSLVKVYQRDRKNKDVQKAAAYALGQFKALDKAIKRKQGESVTEALQRPENAHIAQLLTDIVLNGKRGRRAPRRLLIGLNVILTVTLAIAAVLLLFLPERVIDPNAKYMERLATLSGSPEQLEVAYLGMLVDDLTADANGLQLELLKPAPDCAFAFREPAPYAPRISLSNTAPEIVALAAGYGGMFTRWQAVRAAFQRDCAQNNNSLPSASVSALTSQLADLTDDLPALAEQVAAARASADALAAFAEVTAQFIATLDAVATAQASITPTLTPTPTATPGIPPDDLNRTLSELYSLLDTAQDATRRLDQLWTTVRETGSNQGCTTARPPIPADYSLPAGYGEFLPELQTAVDLINAGLNLTRGGWDTFFNACGNATLANNIDLGLSTATTAANSYAAARDILNGLSAR